MKRFLKKALRWFAILSAALAVLLLVFYAEEDWRGARDWAACQRDLAAKGETLDLRQLAPPGNPKNDLSKVPIFAELYSKDGAINARLHKVTRALGAHDYSNIPHGANYLKGESTDLVVWQKFYHTLPEANLHSEMGTPAQDVLQTLGKFDPELNEVDLAVSNDYAYWPINYDQPFDFKFSGITSLISIAQVIQLKGVAHLENQQTDWAAQDFFFSIRLGYSIRNSGFMVGYLVMAGIRTIDDSILWEGMRRHAWTDAQLRQMEAAYRLTNMLDAARLSLRAERDYSLAATDTIKQGGYEKIHQSIDPFDEDSPKLFDRARLITLRPNGWWDQDKVFYCQEVQKRIDAIHPSSGTLDSNAFDWKEKSALTPDWKKMLFLNLSALSSIDGFGVTAARAETYRRLARLACRLEEYRIAHAQYPDALADLPDLPAHLNQEVLSEQPLHYQRKGDSYTLYSLGWPQKDEGGKLATDPKEGNWPWPSP